MMSKWHADGCPELTPQIDLQIALAIKEAGLLADVAQHQLHIECIAARQQRERQAWTDAWGVIDPDTGDVDPCSDYIEAKTIAEASVGLKIAHARYTAWRPVTTTN